MAKIPLGTIARKVSIGMPLAPDGKPRQWLKVITRKYPCFDAGSASP